MQARTKTREFRLIGLSRNIAETIQERDTVRAYNGKPVGS